MQVIDVFSYLLLEDKERKGVSPPRKVIIHWIINCCNTKGCLSR
jgi:hypothetical protein